MFERFFTVQTAKESTGIGLSIAKVLTEKMGGKRHMDRYEWCGVEPGSEVKNVSGRGRKKDVKAMNIAKIHVWKVPVLLYGDLADRVLIYIHGQGGRKEEAESFAEIATNYGWQVISVDLPEHGERKDKARFLPWEVIPELQKIIAD